MTRARTAWIALAVYAAAILGASSIPSSALPTSGVWHLDKLIHTLEYAVLGALVVHAWWRSGRRSARFALIAFAMAGAFGCVDELYQRTTPGRFSSIADVAADCAGAALGVLAAWGILRRRARQESRDADPELRGQATNHRGRHVRRRDRGRDR